MKKPWLSLAIARRFANARAFAQDNTTHALRPYDKNHPPANCNGNPCDINYNGRTGV